MSGGVLSRVVDRAVNRTALPGRLYSSREATALVQTSPIIDLLVGSALFRDTFVGGGGRGHVDLPRLRAIGVNVIGLTVATSWPDVRGSLSRWHFRSLGLPRQAAGSRMAIAEWVIGRIERWCEQSSGRLTIVRTAGDLDACLRNGGPVGVVLGVQGAHVLEGRVANIGRLRQRGVRLFAPAHVMDNDAVGSNTGGRRGALTSFGQDVVAGLEAQSIVVDLSHMSVAGIESTLPLLKRPFALSHTGIRGAGTTRRRGVRRYGPSTRNVPAELVREVGQRNGLVGVVLSTQLLGGSTLGHAVGTFERAVEAAGLENVAVGSDMDGALRMVIDVEGLPALADAMLEAGMDAQAVASVMGANAARFLRASLQ
jgi:microsomal dipeptidase-like Zn-dependent dipeptidase